MTETLEHTAQRIADRGRDALLDRLRPAFKDAATAHAEVLELNDVQVEQMVQRAADRADGLQWRRALAVVATEELGIGLGEALSHPAVVRAQAIVGAPSYEESLESLAARRPPADDAGPQAAPEQASPEQDAPAREEARGAEAGGPAAKPAELNGDAEPEHHEPLEDEPQPDEQQLTDDEELGEPRPSQPGERAESLRMAVIHVGGVANLTPGERDIELRVSGHGLDIVRGTNETIGRLTWSDIRSLSVPPGKGLRRRRRETRAQLVIRTDHGDASFEVPAIAPDELRTQLARIVERHGRAVEAR